MDKGPQTWVVGRERKKGVIFTSWRSDTKTNATNGLRRPQSRVVGSRLRKALRVERWTISHRVPIDMIRQFLRETLRSMCVGLVNLYQGCFRCLSRIQFRSCLFGFTMKTNSPNNERVCLWVIYGHNISMSLCCIARYYPVVSVFRVLRRQLYSLPHHVDKAEGSDAKRWT